MTRNRALSGAMGLAVVVLFAFQVHRFWFLGDDGYISFCYARNLAEGHGLVWHPGHEPVEGYTNFLWVLLMAAGLVAGIQPEFLAPTLGTASGGVILALVAKLSADRLGWADWRVWIAPLLLCCTRTFPAWCSGGLETQFFTLLVFSGAILGSRELRDGNRAPWSALVLGLAALTRPDGALLAGVVGLFIVGQAARNRTPWPAIRWGLAWSALVVPHLAFRRAYYGDWVPNTFHAKVSGVWLEQSLEYLRLFHHDYGIGWYAGLAVVAVVLRKTALHAVLLAVVLAQLAFIIVVGGDRFEFRFFAHVLPPFFWLVSEGLLALTDRSREQTFARGLAAGAVAIIGIVALMGSIEIEHRSRSSVTTIANMKRVATRRAAQGKRLRELIDAGRLPELKACFQALGAITWHSRLDVLDFHGLTDRVVARQKLRRRGVIGHEKHATPEYMRSQGVQLYDSGGNILTNQKNIVRDLASALDKIGRMGGGLLTRCRVVDEGEFLLYATPTTAEDDDALLGHLPRCPPEIWANARRRTR